MADDDVTGHADPEGEAPWALQIVVQVDKDDVPALDDICRAVALATIDLLDAADANPAWQAAVDRWLDGRIRKIVRRARGSKWDALDSLDGVTATYGSATARAFVPGPVDAVPTAISKLQVAGMPADLDRAPHPPAGVCTGDGGLADEPGGPPGALALAFNTEWDLHEHPGKAAAQAAHAVQLAYTRLDAAEKAAWRDAGCPMVVFWPTIPGWDSAIALAELIITDAGFTVLPEPGETVAAFWNR